MLHCILIMIHKSTWLLLHRGPLHRSRGKSKQVYLLTPFVKLQTLTTYQLLALLQPEKIQVRNEFHSKCIPKFQSCKHQLKLRSVKGEQFYFFQFPNQFCDLKKPHPTNDFSIQSIQIWSQICLCCNVLHQLKLLHEFRGQISKF